MNNSRRSFYSNRSGFWKKVANFFRTKPVLISETAEKCLDDPDRSVALMKAISALKKKRDGGAMQAREGNMVVRQVGKSQSFSAEK